MSKTTTQSQTAWRLITMSDGKQWLTNGTAGIDPDCVPRLLEQRSDLLNTLELIVRYCDNHVPLTLAYPITDIARATIKKVTP